MYLANDPQERLSISKYANAPDLPAHGLLSIQRGGRSTRSRRQVDLSEAYIVTRSAIYSKQLTHWVHARRDEDCARAVADQILDLGIIPYGETEGFDLNDPCNLAYFHPSIHDALDRDAFVAITAASSTVDQLPAMVIEDNNSRQKTADETGRLLPRLLDFSMPCISEPMLELVALQPERFLPEDDFLVVHQVEPRRFKTYVVADDRHLRETSDPSSSLLPPFGRAYCPKPVSGTPSVGRIRDSDNWDNQANIFLVILNANLRFRRYLQLIDDNPPSTQAPLPDDVISLMHRTMNLVDLLYWVPRIREGTKGEIAFTERKMRRRKNPEWRAGLQTPPIDTGSGQEESESEMDNAKDSNDNDGASIPLFHPIFGLRQCTFLRSNGQVLIFKREKLISGLVMTTVISVFI